MDWQAEAEDQSLQKPAQCLFVKVKLYVKVVHVCVRVCMCDRVSTRPCVGGACFDHGATSYTVDFRFKGSA